MKLNYSALLVLTAVACGIAYGAVTKFGHSNWREFELKSDKTLKEEPANLQKAEDQLMMAIEVAFKDRVPEKNLVPIYSKMGDLMMKEGKFEESQKYFLRVVQFNNALGVETDENVAQLHKLEQAYEKARDYEQAEQTQGVLVKLIEIEKSPNDPSYPAEKEKLDQLKLKVAQFNNPAGLPPVKVADKVETPQERKQQESLLTGWH